ncbi:MAG: PrsW family intramembrane metalloprotease [Deltaproteobacteria bacterium]|nr:PrsW family intramembrane metalloprotease [Deltaproteobacteria bacterium]
MLVLWYFLARDANPEPRGVLWRTFWLGVATTIPAGLAEVAEAQLLEPAQLGPLGASLGSAFLGAALCEELLKFCVVYYYCARQPAFDEPMDGIVYGVTASLGFATLENILYVADNGMGVAVVRALLAVPGHACYGAIMGYFVALSRFGPRERRRANLALSLAVPMALHGAYDAPLFLLSQPNGGADAALPWLWVPVAVVVLGWRYTVRRVRELAAAQIGPAAAVAEVEVVRSPGSRRVVRWIQLGSGALLAGWGGLVSLAIAAAVALDTVQPEEVAPLAVGTAVVGLLPLAVGLLLFRKGLARPTMARPTMQPLSSV